MNSSNSRYGIRSNGLNHGDVFTSPDVIRFMLDTAGYTPDVNLSNFCVLEPSFGMGDFLLEIQRRIIESAKKYSFDATKAFQKCVFACELDSCKFVACTKQLQVLMPDFLPINFKNEDFLFTEWPIGFDLIIGNPPYVRYENIPAEIRNVYKSKFKTFHYRSDLYILFYEHSLKFLSPGGRHCFICSNRWLKNEYGKRLRALVAKCYNLERLIDIEKINAFQEAVLAYPAISIISNTVNKREVQFASIDKLPDLNSFALYKIKKYNDIDDLSTIFTNDLNYNLPTIEDQDFSIGIGVATGADRIFISGDLVGKIESELLMPIICAKDLSGNKFKYNGLCLLNPYDKHGDLIDLNLYPKAKAYLEEHKTTLQKRHIVKKNRIWYALIDKIKPGIIYEPKILLPDISANTYIFMDNGNFYPSHNIYYITSDKHDKEKLSILAAILMSDFARNQIINISNKMKGGFPRWQSQVLKKIRIPYINGIPLHYKRRLLNAYENFNIEEINNIVNSISIISFGQPSFRKRIYSQLSLFDASSFTD